MRTAALISGRGSNLAALIDASRRPGARAGIALVISSRPDAAGLQRARAAGIAAEVIDHRRFERREEFDRQISDLLERNSIELVCLAGFMRVLSSWFVARWRDRVLNIHPSLLPAFPGLDTHSRALAAGVRFAGCTVHFVRAEVDAGPIIVQSVVPVRIEDTVEALAARVLASRAPLLSAGARAGRVRARARGGRARGYRGSRLTCDDLDQSRTDVTSGPDVIIASAPATDRSPLSHAERRAAQRLAGAGRRAARCRRFSRNDDRADGPAIWSGSCAPPRKLCAGAVDNPGPRSGPSTRRPRQEPHPSRAAAPAPAGRPAATARSALCRHRMPGVVLCRGRTSGVVPGYRRTTGVAAGRALSDPFFLPRSAVSRDPHSSNWGRAAHKPRGACRKRYIT